MVFFWLAYALVALPPSVPCPSYRIGLQSWPGLVDSGGLVLAYAFHLTWANESLTQDFRWDLLEEALFSWRMLRREDGSMDSGSYLCDPEERSLAENETNTRNQSLEKGSIIKLSI